jgi:hypothetical protein
MLDRFFAIEFDFLIDSIARCPHWPEKPKRFAPRVQYEGLRFSERRDFAREMRIGFGGPAFSRQDRAISMPKKLVMTWPYSITITRIRGTKKRCNDMVNLSTEPLGLAQKVIWRKETS